MSEIIYQTKDSVQTINHVILKSDVFMIKFANGTREVMQETSPTPQTEVFDEKNVYLLHKELGLEIEGWMKKRYHLFNEISDNDFASAMMYLPKDGKGNKTVKIFLADGTVKRRVVTETEIKGYVATIDQYVKKDKRFTRIMVVGAICVGVFYIGIYAVALAYGH